MKLSAKYYKKWQGKLFAQTEEFVLTYGEMCNWEGKIAHAIQSMCDEDEDFYKRKLKKLFEDSINGCRL